MVKKTVKANIPQGKFLQMPQKFRSYVGGYGCGKTTVGIMQLCINAWRTPGFSQGFFAPTYSHIRDIFYPTIEEVSYSMGLSVDIKEGNKEVFLSSGGQQRSLIKCRSMERPQSIIGFKISHAMIDEIDVFPVDKATIAWRKILARMRYKNAKNSVDVTTTPEGYLFTYNTFVKALSEKPEMKNRYGIIQASTYDNEINLPDDYIPSLIEAYPKELIDAYLNGQFVNMRAGTVYYAFDRKAHNSNETIKEGEPLFIGMDFNVTKMAATIYVQRPNGWHVVAELKEIFDTPDIIEIIQEKWPAHPITVYPDASGDSRKTINAAASDIALLRAARFRIKARKKNPFVKDRVIATNKRFQAGQLWVNVKACPVVTECFEQQSYDANGEPDKKSGKDHQNDASTYPIAYEFPIQKRNIKPFAPMG